MSLKIGLRARTRGRACEAPDRTEWRNRIAILPIQGGKPVDSLPKCDCYALQSARFSGVLEGNEIKLQDVVDRGATPPYMPLHRTGRRLHRLSHHPVANIDGHSVPRPKSGSIGCPPETVTAVAGLRIFDIVGIDEGTCGRRRLLPVALGRRLAV